jgi:heme exporter protein B
LIFGAGAVGAEASGLGADANLLLLAGGLAAAAALTPWATVAALRIALE